MSIGQRIKKARKDAKLTQMELAKKTNLSRSYIGDIEIDRYNPSITTLQTIAEATGVSASYLLGWKRPNTTEEIKEDAALLDILFKNDPVWKKKLKSVHLDGTFNDGKKACDLSPESIARIEDAIRISFERDQINGKAIVEIDE